MKVYLAGPMSGKPMNNFPAFFTAAMALRVLGFDVVNPAECDMARGMDPTGSLSPSERHKVMLEDFKLLLDCEGIALLPGWEKSEGARAEREVAIQIGLSVFYLDASCWLEVACI